MSGRTRRQNASAAPEEVDQINVDNGIGATSSNTLSGASRRPAGDVNDNPANLHSDVDELIDAQIAAAQSAEQALATEVENLRQKQAIVDSINQRILELEQYKGTLRETLRFTTSASNSVREQTPASGILPSREGPTPTPGRPLTPYGIGTDSESDILFPEPPYNELKMHLDREKTLKVRPSDPYRGKDLREHRSFVSHWEGIFRTQPWTYNRHSARVYSAASYMKDEPHDAWEAALKQNPPAKIQWDSFVAFLANLIQAPQTRRQDAFEGLRDLQQKDGETVAELYTRMISLEVDQDQRPERDRVRTLDAALSDYRTKQMLVSILSGDEAVSVLDWLEKAQKAEHISHPKSKRNKPNESGKGNSAPKDPGSSYTSSANQERRKRKDRTRKNRDGPSGGNSSTFRSQTRPSASDSITCYTCGQKGHYSGNSKCPKYDEWAKQNPDKAKAIEESKRLQRQVNAIALEERGRSTSLKETGKGKAKS